MEPGNLFSGGIQCESVKLPPPEARVPKSGVFYENDGLLPTAERAVNGYRGDAANADDRVDFIPLHRATGLGVARTTRMGAAGMALDGVRDLGFPRFA